MAHRGQQANLANQLANLLAARWRYAFSDSRGGADEYMAAAMRAIALQYKASAALSRTFYRTSRSLATPGAPRFDVEIPPFSEESARISQVATALKTLSDTGDLDKAMRAGVAAGVRTALAGGRRGILGSVERDSVALGYFWQTRQDGKAPCHWCAMLASRGVVYKRESWPETDPRPHGFLKVSAHDSCACHLAPVWTRDQGVEQFNRDMQTAWQIVTKDAFGEEKLRVWRAWYSTRDAQQVAS